MDVEKVDVPISIEDIEKGLMGVDINPPKDEETKYSNLDVEFEKVLKSNTKILPDDEEDFFIITEDPVEEP